MTNAEIEQHRQFIRQNISVLDGEIRRLALLQKAYKAGGDTMAESLEKVSTALGANIAAREVFQQELDELGLETPAASS